VLILLGAGYDSRQLSGERSRRTVLDDRVQGACSCSGGRAAPLRKRQETSCGRAREWLEMETAKADTDNPINARDRALFGVPAEVAAALLQCARYVADAYADRGRRDRSDAPNAGGVRPESHAQPVLFGAGREGLFSSRRAPRGAYASRSAAPRRASEPRVAQFPQRRQENPCPAYGQGHDRWRCPG